jgi:hypothetical protein
VATTIAFTTLIPGQTPVSLSHFEQLRSAVNAIRGAANQTPLTWETLLPAGTPVPASAQDVLAQHMVSLRSKLDEARRRIGVPVLVYTAPVLTNVPIRIVHQLEIRGGVQ